MKPITGLEQILIKAKKQNIFGTKMRSVIKEANKNSINSVVEQQFEIADQILASNLIPIVEPEVDINCSEKPTAESYLLEAIEKKVDGLDTNKKIILKLTLPDVDNLFLPLANHDSVLRVVALSGGYAREEANKRLSANKKLIASFSRALTEGLYAQQTDEEFSKLLASSIESIYRASH